MSKQKDPLPSSPKTRIEQFMDGVLGCDEEMDDELASAILAEYGIDESSLVDDFKRHLQEEVRQLPENSIEASNLIATIKNIGEYQKTSAPDAIEPKKYIEDLFDAVRLSNRKPVYAFRNRKERELSEKDKNILDELENELNDETE